ncbi:unnamed protein product [Brassica rapa subsp. narinosa]|uniref:Uncharacterized protein n=1 Tax=Brassica campestris TaxID=3711 RepID=A0A3P6BVZ2_BRACM|nr:unnamed protein product [Brassica rapa]
MALPFLKKYRLGVFPQSRRYKYCKKIYIMYIIHFQVLITKIEHKKENDQNILFNR